MVKILQQKRQQASIMIGLISCGITEGFIFGQMSGMLADLQMKDSPIFLSDDDISWIASTINIMCIFGYALATAVTEFMGRKKTIALLTAPIILCWILVYFANTVFLLMSSRVLVGACFGAVLMLSYVSIGEYAPPETRALRIYLTSALTPSIGVALGHVLCTILHWRTVALIGIIPSAIATVSPFLWVESPTWLASKGKFVECEKAFRALHSHRREAENELQLLLEVEKPKTAKKKTFLQSFWLAMRKTYFWKLFFLLLAVIVYKVGTGKLLFNTYGITILRDMTGRADLLFFTILVNGFNLIGASLACILIRKMNMRTVLFFLGVVGIIILIVLSVRLNYQTEDDLYFPWVNSALLGLYFIIINAGPYPTTDALLAELAPIELKSLFFILIGIISSVVSFLSVKIITDIINSIGYACTFALHAVVSALCLVYLWIYVPETKGKTLQELEIETKNQNHIPIDHEIEEQSKLVI